MRALTWQGNEDVQVSDVADPQIKEPTDAIIRVTSTAICGSDLHLYGVLGPRSEARGCARARGHGHRRGNRSRGHGAQVR